ncbi:efflux RND transporter periplasmic adaptor subunit [Brevundimonas nasdae]|uniref:efflux RND transporter periplasmic adaptor subunit n=1 Tax=Brevundimonas nasdae TaxID=172043 RepID=UPI0028986E3D|nr:efflux RND transporter periplasmic adaptor subunit [Brevundimonas nasdae]
MKLHLPLLACVLAVAACKGGDANKIPTANVAPPAAVARGVIDAEPGLVTLAAPFDGVVRSLRVKEGDQVAAGVQLASLDDRLARLTLTAANAEIAEIEARVAAASAAANRADVEAARLRRLADADAGSRQDADRARDAARLARDELTTAQRAADTARARRQLDAYAVDARTITAPTAGRIVRRWVSEGASVTAGTPLFMLEPAGARVVRAEVDEEFADKLKPGMTAIVSLESDTSRTFQARLVRISEMFGPSQIVGDPTAPSDTRSISVILQPTGEQPNLRLGQRVLVRIAP